MQVTANLNYLRIAPRKVRLVADLIRRKDAKQAQAVLGFVRARAAKPLLKLLNSALANATHNHQLSSDNLFIVRLSVDQGPILKRFFPRARGQASPIQKKTSHITLVLAEKVPGKKVRPVKAAAKPAEQKIEGKPETDKTKPAKISPRAQREQRRQISLPRGIRKMFQRKAF